MAKIPGASAVLVVMVDRTERTIQLKARRYALVLFAAFGLSSRAGGETVVLTPVRDATIFSSPTTGANARGDLFVGRNNSNSNRRALLKFDLSAIPADSTIESVTLQLTMTRTNAAATVIHLYPLEEDWGSAGNGDGGGSGGGQADTAVTGDATWIHRFYSTVPWAVAGGDFDDTESASVTAGLSFPGIEFSTAAMMDDVEDWVERPEENFGWILRGDEQTLQSVVAFRSSEASSGRPTLTVIYTPDAPDDSDNDGVSDASDNCPDIANASQDDYDDDGLGDDCDDDDDDDGLPDTVEIEHALNPHDSHDGSDDKDGDGYSNLNEYLAGTDISSASSRPMDMQWLQIFIELLLED